MNNLLAERDKRVEGTEQQSAHQAELMKISKRRRKIGKEKAKLEK